MDIDFIPNLPTMEDIRNPDKKQKESEHEPAWEWTTLEAARLDTIKQLDKMIARSQKEDIAAMRQAGVQIEPWRYEITEVPLFYELMKRYLPTKATDKESYTEELRESVRNTQACYRAVFQDREKHDWKLPAIRAANIIKQQQPEITVYALAEQVAKQLKKDGVKNNRGRRYLSASTIKRELLSKTGFNI